MEAAYYLAMLTMLQFQVSMRLKGRTRPSVAWIVTKCLKVGPLLISSISLVVDYKLQIGGGVLPGNADNVAVPGEHEAEG